MGLLGTGGAETAEALGPAILLSVTVAPAAASVAKGQSEQFIATGHYSDLSTADLTNSVTWSSSSTSVATVSNSSGAHGKATATGVGLATITATDPSSLIKGTAALTVTPAILVTVTVAPAAASVAKGNIQQFTATGTYSDLSTADPTNGVTWSSSSTSVATVSNSAGSRGVVTAIWVGLATITGTDPSSLVKGTAALTVTPATLVTLTVAPAATSVASGNAEQFTATGIYSDLSTTDLTDSVTWSSSSAAATISNAAGSQGLATGLAPGVSTITATDPTTLIPGTAALTVLPAVLTAVTVSPAVASIDLGQTQQFTATGLYSDGTTKNLTDTVTWSSAQGLLATISNAAGSQGLATGLAPGVSTITATDPTTLIPGTAALTVLPGVVNPPPGPPTAPVLTVTPSSGKKRSAVVTHGAGFVPGGAIVVTYLSGLRSPKRASTVLCNTTVAPDGTFSCGGTIPRLRKAGKRGNHTVVANESPAASGTTIFTLLR